MVHVHDHRAVFDFMDAHGYDLPLGTLRRQYRADFQTIGGKFFFRDFLKGIFVNRPIGVFRFDRDILLAADLHAGELPLQTGDHCLLPVDILERFTTFVGVDHFAVGALERVIHAHQHAIFDDPVVLGFLRGGDR